MRALATAALFVVSFALLAQGFASSGNPESCFVDQRCTREADCLFGSCCGGVCVPGGITSPAFLSLGAVCDMGALPCTGNCAVGSCMNGRCERAGFAPTCACQVNSQCASGMCSNATTPSQCVDKNLPPAAPCQFSAQCLTNSCVGGTCRALGQNELCEQTIQCAAPLACVQNACQARRVLDEFCVSDSDCATGLACNVTTCITARQGVNGQPSTTPLACESGAVASDSFATPQRTQTCAPAVPTGGQNDTCTRTGDCKLGFACIGSAGSARCSYVANQRCTTSDVFACGNGFACQCNTCQAIASPGTPAECDSQSDDLYVAYAKWFGPPTSTARTWYGITGVPINGFSALRVDLLPDEPKAAYLNFMCCIAQTRGFAYSDWASGGQFMAYKVNCGSTKSATALTAEEIEDAGKCTLAKESPQSVYASGINFDRGLVTSSAAALVPASLFVLALVLAVLAL